MIIEVWGKGMILKSITQYLWGQEDRNLVLRRELQIRLVCLRRPWPCECAYALFVVVDFAARLSGHFFHSKSIQLILLLLRLLFHRYELPSILHSAANFWPIIPQKQHWFSFKGWDCWDLPFAGWHKLCC